MPPKVSIINLTLERYKAAVDGLKRSIERIEYPNVEWLVWDNGSEDRRVPELVKSLGPDFFHAHHENIGVAKAKNQLFLRATGDYLMSIDPDIVYPELWVTKLMNAAEAIPNTGLAGYYPGVGPGDLTDAVINGIDVRLRRRAIYGGYFFPREVQEEIGYIYEGYGLYAHTTADFGIRVSLTGRLIYYLEDSKHLERARYGEPKSYTEMKRRTKKRYAKHKLHRYNGLKRGKVDPYVPPPEKMAL